MKKFAKIILILFSIIIFFSCSKNVKLSNNNSDLLCIDNVSNQYFILNPVTNKKKITELSYIDKSKKEYENVEYQDIILDSKNNSIYILRNLTDGKTLIYQYDINTDNKKLIYEFDDRYSELQISERNIYVSKSVKTKKGIVTKYIYKIDRKLLKPELLYESNENWISSFCVFEEYNKILLTENSEIAKFEHKSKNINVFTNSCYKIFSYDINTKEKKEIDNFSWRTTYSIKYGKIIYKKDFDVKLDKNDLIKSYDLKSDEYIIINYEYFGPAGLNFFIDDNIAVIGIEKNRFKNNFEIMADGKWDTQYLLYNVKTGKSSKFFDSKNYLINIKNVSL